MELRTVEAKGCLQVPLPEPWVPPSAPSYLCSSSLRQPSGIPSLEAGRQQAPQPHSSEGDPPSMDTSLNTNKGVFSFFPFFLYIGL